MALGPEVASPASRPRRRRLWRWALVAALLGAALGVVASLLDPIVDPAEDGGTYGGPVQVRIVDASGDVEQYGPPTVEVSAIGGTVTFEQYATRGRIGTGLSWGADEPLVVTFRPRDPDLGPGLTATLDLAPFVAGLREAAQGSAPRRPRPLVVYVEVGTATTTLRIRVDDEVLLEESIARQDWREARAAAAEACAVEVAGSIGASTAGVAEVTALVTSWYDRSLPFTRWVTEVDRGLRLVRSTRAALPGEDAGLAELRLAGAWVTDMEAELAGLESALLTLRSAAVAESSGRFQAAFVAVDVALRGRLARLTEEALPLLWCAAR